MDIDLQTWDTSPDQHVFRTPQGIEPARLTTYNSAEGITHLTDRNGEPDKNTIFIATDGSFRHAALEPTASYGVYFGPNSPYNQSAHLPLSETQGSNSAEYYAAKVTIAFMQNHMWSEGQCEDVRKIVILTDSDLMVTALIKDIKTWREKGCHKKLKNQIASFDILFSIDRMTRELYRQGRIIKFWNVPRDYNKNADRLAKQGHTQRGTSSFEYMIDRPWKEWTLAKQLFKTPEERARSEAVITRISFPIVPKDNKWTASITSFLIARWVLNKEYRKEHPLKMMGQILGPKYRDCFFQEQENLETSMGKLRHEIDELSQHRQTLAQRYQIFELELHLEVRQQVLKKLRKYLADALKEIQPINPPEQTLPLIKIENKQHEVLSKETPRPHKPKTRQPNMAPQISSILKVEEVKGIPISLTKVPDSAAQELSRKQQKKRNKRKRKAAMKEALKAQKRSGKHAKK